MTALEVETNEAFPGGETNSADFVKLWGLCNKLAITLTIRIAREYLIRVCTCKCGFLIKGQFLFPSVLSLFRIGVSYTSLRASGSRLLCCLLLSWIKGFSLVPQMLRQHLHDA